MMIKSTVIAVAALLFSSSVYASCEGKDKLLFACLTEKGKQIEVCNFGQTIRYSYGRPKTKPEIVVIVPREKVAGSSCSTCGRYLTNSVTIPSENAFFFDRSHAPAWERILCRSSGMFLKQAKRPTQHHI